MARPKKSGLNVTRKRRADGSVVEYFYDRKTGTFLGNDRDKAATRQLVLWPSTTKVDLPEGSFGWLINEYKASSLYLDRAPGTKRLYDGYLRHMMADYGDLPIRSIRPKTIAAIKKKYAANRSKANQILALFRILLGHAYKDLEAIPDNPAACPKRYEPAKREQVWSEADIELFIDAAPANIKLAMGLMLHTVQRLGDFLAMDLSQVSEKNGRLFIALRQAKTNTWVDVPVHRRLEPLLRARIDMPIVRKRVGTDGRKFVEEAKYLVPSPEGHRWVKRNFARAWDGVVRRVNYRLARRMLADGLAKPEIREKLLGRHRQRRDLRRTGMVRMAEAGATTAQIAAVSGHSIDSCQRILDVYIPRGTELALGAIAAWERNLTIEGFAQEVRMDEEGRFAKPLAPQPKLSSSSR